MRNRGAERALAARTFDVDVDPLTIVRACRELIDPLLIDRDPSGNTKLAFRRVTSNSAKT